MNAQPQDRSIFHIAPRSLWEQTKDKSEYRGDTLESEGFIHCSTRNQVLAVANALFSERQDLVLLLLQTSRILSLVKYEGVTSEMYPHIYGPINRDAIIAVYDFLPDKHGKFSLPQEALQLFEA